MFTLVGISNRIKATQRVELLIASLTVTESFPRGRIHPAKAMLTVNRGALLRLIRPAKPIIRHGRILGFKARQAFQFTERVIGDLIGAAHRRHDGRTGRRTHATGDSEAVHQTTGAVAAVHGSAGMVPLLVTLSGIDDANGVSAAARLHAKATFVAIGSP